MSISNISTSMLLVFEAVADERSFTKAANRLSLTQSGISHSIRSLEEALGTTLIVRDHSKIELTGAGERALKEARGVNEAIQRLRNFGRQKELSGKVYVGVVPSAAASVVPIAVKAVRRDHPLLHVEVLEGTDQEVAKWVEDGIVELGLCGINKRREQIVLTDQYLLVSPLGRLPMDGASADLRNLNGAAFIMSGSGCEPDIRRLLRKAGVKVEVTMKIRDLSALLSVVAAGEGVSLIPELALFNANRSGVTMHPIRPKCARQLRLLTKTRAANDSLEVVYEALRRAANAAQHNLLGRPWQI